MEKQLFLLEAGEGAGKKALLKKLNTKYKEEGYGFCSHREPGGTEAGAMIRSLIMSGEKPVTEMNKAFGMLTCRAEVVRTKVIPDLEAGKIVFKDRYVDSFFALQTEVEKLFSFGTAGVLNQIATDFHFSSKTILLDLPPEVGPQRKQGQTGKNLVYEQKEIDFHNQVRQAHLNLASKNNERFVVINAMQLPEFEFQQVVQGIGPIIRKHAKRVNK